MEIKQYAPICIPTLNRYEHFKRCLESLERCAGAEKTEVYVGLDYPPSDKYVEGWKKIDAYLAEKEKNNGFDNLIVRRRDHNCGVGSPTSNGSLLLKEARTVSDRYILSEDDNEFSPNFILYINQCLEKYKDNPNILYICGWSNPRRSSGLTLGKFIYNAYPMHGFSAYGYGGWFNKSAVDFYKKEEIIYSYRNTIWAMTHHHSVMIHNLLPFMRSKAQIGDVIREYYCARNGVYCIFPTISKVRNWGYDGSGDHCVVWEEPCMAKIDTNTTFSLDEFEIKDYPEIRCVEKLVYDETPKLKLYFCVEYVWFRLTKKLIKDTWLFRIIKRIVFK